MIRFDWDERKNKSNRAKHGVWFEEARSVFDDLHARLFCDPEHSQEEDRFILLGLSVVSRMLVVIHCYRGSRLVGSDHLRAKSNQEGGSSL